jgi:hypothetical protein
MLRIPSADPLQNPAGEDEEEIIYDATKEKLLRWDMTEVGSGRDLGGDLGGGLASYSPIPGTGLVAYVQGDVRPPTTWTRLSRSSRKHWPVTLVMVVMCLLLLGLLIAWAVRILS